VRTAGILRVPVLLSVCGMRGVGARFLRSFPLLALCFVCLCLSAVPAHADPTLQRHGRHAWNRGLRGAQTVDFSFQVTWDAYYVEGQQDGYILDFLPGGQATGYGPLGTNWSIITAELFAVAADPSGDSFWLELSDTYQGPVFSSSPDTDPGQLWGYQEGCGSEACMVDFVDAN
jgi:hypothetical protein